MDDGFGSCRCGMIFVAVVGFVMAIEVRVLMMLVDD